MQTYTGAFLCGWKYNNETTAATRKSCQWSLAPNSGHIHTFEQTYSAFITYCIFILLAIVVVRSKRKTQLTTRNRHLFCLFMYMPTDNRQFPLFALRKNIEMHMVLSLLAARSFVRCEWMASGVMDSIAKRTYINPKSLWIFRRKSHRL